MQHKISSKYFGENYQPTKTKRQTKIRMQKQVGIMMVHLGLIVNKDIVAWEMQIDSLLSFFLANNDNEDDDDEFAGITCKIKEIYGL